MVTSKNPPRFLTTPPSHLNNLHHPEEEFDESDIVWSSSSSSTATATTATTATTTTLRPFNHHHPPSTITGLSAALFATEEPQSPTSIQRKTTSSPVSMISGSSEGGGPMVGSSYNYGRRFHQSAPVNVPVWPSWTGADPRRGGGGPVQLGRFDEDMDGDDGGLYDDGGMVPPHEIVARSQQQTTTFSVIEGAGRTLKGRDLTAVRNAVFQRTGFLE